MHANIETLRSELLQHINKVHQHLEHHDPRGSGHHKSSSSHPHLTTYVYIFAAQVVLFCGFLLVKGHIDRSREKERKWM